ncbi:MAG: protein dehydratase, partial [Pseudomonadota bacterium]
QTIVYRTLDAGTSAPAAAPAAPQGEAVSIIDPSAALLFRYSALTFNTHRIHYDRPYATEVEGYPGLVVHGPLQATLLFHHAVHQAGGAIPVAFDFRSVSSLSDGTMLHLHAGHLADGIMPLWTASPDGPVAMQAEARWV